MLDDVLLQLNALLQRALTLDFLLQVGLFMLVLLVAYALRGVARRQVAKLQERLKRQGLVMEQLPWTLDLLVALSAVIFPLVVWVLGSVAAGALRAAARPTDLLAWLVPVFGLWALYRFVATLLDLNLSPARAKAWGRQILRPIVVLLIILQLTGMLDNLLGVRLNPGQGVLVTLQSVLLGMAALIFFFWLSRIIRRFLAETALPRAGVEPAVNQVISTFTGYALVIAGFLLALSVMGINITTLTVIAGGVSVGIGFGLQELINNFVSGFILLTERSLAPGDIIEVDGNIGKVQQIGLRTMQITTPDDVELIIPNGHLLGSTVTSYTHKSPEMRVHIELPATAAIHPRTVQETLLEAARSHPEVLATPEPTARVVEFEGQTIRYDLELWIHNPVRAPYITSDVRVHIWELFSERGIEMDVPQDVLLVKTDE